MQFIADGAVVINSEKLLESGAKQEEAAETADMAKIEAIKRMLEVAYVIQKNLTTTATTSASASATSTSTSLTSTSTTLGSTTTTENGKKKAVFDHVYSVLLAGLAATNNADGGGSVRLAALVGAPEDREQAWTQNQLLKWATPGTTIKEKYGNVSRPTSSEKAAQCIQAAIEALDQANDAHCKALFGMDKSAVLEQLEPKKKKAETPGQKAKRAKK
jgi:hypothetical protein